MNLSANDLILSASVITMLLCFITAYFTVLRWRLLRKMSPVCDEIAADLRARRTPPLAPLPYTSWWGKVPLNTRLDEDDDNEEDDWTDEEDDEDGKIIDLALRRQCPRLTALMHGEHDEDEHGGA